MKASTLNLKQLSKRIPCRPRDSHKGMFGTVVVIGGQSGMVGAALLAARAALQLGAGRVHAVLLAEDAPSVDLLQPELMLHKAAELLRFHPHPNLPPSGEGTNVSNMFNPDVLALGCGMGTGLNAQKLLHNAIQSQAALVLDADALNILAMRPDLRTLLGARSAPTLLTPHPGEAARLLGCDIGDIQQNRLEKADELRSRYHSSVVLKGAGSVCATSDGKLYINSTGNPGMSSAGMGDVLTGILAALVAQGLAADDALLLAVHLHGAAGDELAQQNAMLGMSATEVTAWARWLFNRIAKE
ncbi:MAG: NAD(P)H-hydrate dehydratase [Gallionella sp.]|nr:NAD(P)H-hydrate dehydratase [Gallionella sp.]